MLGPMKPLVILKLGSTFEALRSQRGDFTDWIGRGLDLAPQRIRIVDAPAGQPLPDGRSIAGAVVTGSHAMVTDEPAWNRPVSDWFVSLVRDCVPLLAICYGHQLLARALGGRAGANPNGLEFGYAQIRLSEAGRTDPLLGVLPETFRAPVCHAQSALTLPPEAVCLASSEAEPNQAFRIGPTAWGVQFHPEFDAGAARFYIRQFADRLTAQGADPEGLLAGCVENTVGPRLFERFLEIVADRDVGR